MINVWMRDGQRLINDASIRHGIIQISIEIAREQLLSYSFENEKWFGARESFWDKKRSYCVHSLAIADVRIESGKNFEDLLGWV